MSTISLQVTENPHRHTDNGHKIDVKPSLAIADNGQVTGHASDQGSDQADPVAIEQFVVQVLRRAHDTAETENNPDEARAIFHVAVYFAAELETVNSTFNRFSFIEAATGL